MSGFATKPVELMPLKMEMRRVLDLPTQKAGTGASADAWPIVDEINAVATWAGMREAWLDAVRLFLDKLPDQAASVRKGLQAGGQDAVGPVHALRGSAGSLGFTALFHRLSHLETALRQDPAPPGAALLEELDDCLSQTEQRARQLVAGDVRVSGALGVFDRATATTAWDLLLRALARGEAPRGQLDALRAALGTTAPSALVHDLERALEDYDFDIATQHLHALKTWMDSQP